MLSNNRVKIKIGYIIIFLSTLIIRLIIFFSSNSWLSIWISLEVNLFSFIPLILTISEINKEKSSIIYFLNQTISSRILLICSILIILNQQKNFVSLIIIFIMILKIGLFPFHMWVISIIENINWKLIFLLTTIQKIIPIIIISICIKEKTLLIIILINFIISSLIGISSFSLRKIMNFSSINHISIIIISLVFSKKIFRLYLLIYFFINWVLILKFEKRKINFSFETLKQTKKKTTDIVFTILIFNIMGIPPFIRFVPKVIIFIKIIEFSIILPLIILIIFNTISTFFYLRIIFSNLIINLNSLKKRKRKRKSLSIWIILRFLILILEWSFRLKKPITFKVINIIMF